MAGRLSRHRHPILLAILVVATVAAWVLMRGPKPEYAPDNVPQPAEPFGIAERGNLRFRWLLPRDRVPVRVELLDAERTVIWTSELVVGDVLAPPADRVSAFPDGDLYWRPVAVTAGGETRAGDIAAFHLPEKR